MTTLNHPAHAMDRMYRYTRHVYDLSRRYYLLGRDTLLKQMDVRPDDRVLEVGCGTARNLIKLAHLTDRQPLMGLDAAQVMIDTAQRQVDRAGLGSRVALRQGLAEQLDPADFGVEQFDVIFFSYALSMIPTWPDSLDAAMRCLPSGRTLYVVDFWDQADLPRWFAAGLKRWLALFHVHHRPELLDAMRRRTDSTLTLQPISGRYAYLAALTKR